MYGELNNNGKNVTLYVCKFTVQELSNLRTTLKKVTVIFISYSMNARDGMDVMFQIQFENNVKKMRTKR